MSYLVIELQRSALDDSVTTINLLRKALVVAKKLKISEFEKSIYFQKNPFFLQLIGVFIVFLGSILISPTELGTV